MPTRMPNRLTRGLSVLLALAAIVILVEGIRETASFTAPVILAGTIALCAHPMTCWLRDHRVPGGLAAALTLVFVLGIVVIVGAAMVWALLQFATLLPTYANDATRLLNSLSDWGAEKGVSREQVDQVIDSIDPGKIARYVAGIVTSTASLLFTGFLMIFVLAFMIFDGPAMERAVAGMKGHDNLARALLQATADTRKNLIVTGVFGFGLAVVITIILYLLQIPGAPIWGVLTFITNFIPNIGFVIRLVPPVLIGLLEGGLGLALTVAIAFSVANVLSENVLQPRIVGQAAGVTPTVAMLSVIFWAFALGPIGAVLALPLTIFAKAVLVDCDPEMGWLAQILEGDYGRTRDEMVELPDPATLGAAEAND